MVDNFHRDAIWSSMPVATIMYRPVQMLHPIFIILLTQKVPFGDAHGAGVIFKERFRRKNVRIKSTFVEIKLHLHLHLIVWSGT